MIWNHSPSDINFMLHCYYSPEKHERIDAPALQETARYLVQEGLIEPSSKALIYHATDKGRAWVSAICCTPYPRQAWIGVNGEELDSK